MNRITMEWGDHWMRTEEKGRARSIARGLRERFIKCGVDDSPLIALRVEDLLVAYLLAHRLEEQLAALDTAAREKAKREKAEQEQAQQENADDDKPDRPKPVREEPLPSLASVVESIGKARERMRKAIKELEDACAKLGTPIDVGLAEKYRPVIEAARGVEDAACEDGPEVEPKRKMRV